MHISNDYIYIVVSKTHTLLGRAIQHSLGVSVNHSSITTDASLANLYSFGRKGIYNVFNNGFVEESINEGFFKRYGKTEIYVLRLEVEEDLVYNVNQRIVAFQNYDPQMQYSILGLLYCYFGIDRKRQNKYFCSQFVAEMLRASGYEGLTTPPSLMRPHDFFNLPGVECIYRGMVQYYSPEYDCFMGENVVAV